MNPRYQIIPLILKPSLIGFVSIYFWTSEDLKTRATFILIREPTLAMRPALRGFVGVLAIATTVTSLSFQPKRSDSSSSIIECLDNHHAHYAVSTSANWTQLITPYNLRLSYTPVVVVLPETSEEVGDAVICAAAAGLKVQPKGGGHSYASYSSGGRDGSVVIDLESFNSVEVDQSQYSYENP